MSHAFRLMFALLVLAAAGLYLGLCAVEAVRDHYTNKQHRRVS